MWIRLIIFVEERNYDYLIKMLHGAVDETVYFSKSIKSGTNQNLLASALKLLLHGNISFGEGEDARLLAVGTFCPTKIFRERGSTAETQVAVFATASCNKPIACFATYVAFASMRNSLPNICC